MMKQQKRPKSLYKQTKIQSNSHSHIKTISNITKLINKKYYYPALQEQQRHNAQQLTHFLSDQTREDQLQLGEILIMYKQCQYLTQYQSKALDNLKGSILRYSKPAQQNKDFSHHIYIMHFHSFPYLLLQDNRRRKKIIHIKKSFQKKEQHLKSTQIQSKKQQKMLQDLNVFNDNNQTLNKSQIQLNKLSKALQNILKKNATRNYDVFLAEMENKNHMQQKQKQKSQGMIKLILDLEKDFSSIYEERVDDQVDFSKESIYGLSDIRKKYKKNNLINDGHKNKEIKDKKVFNNFPFCRVDLSKKIKETANKNGSSKYNSSSKTSNKSTSMKSKKQNDETNNSKSKSRSHKKYCIKLTNSDKKSKIMDSQKIYFDETPDIHQQKLLAKSNTLKDQLHRRSDLQSQKNKKKLVKR